MCTEAKKRPILEQTFLQLQTPGITHSLTWLNEMEPLFMLIFTPVLSLRREVKKSAMKMVYLLISKLSHIPTKLADLVIYISHLHPH